jgi:hypothetical protein
MAIQTSTFSFTVRDIIQAAQDFGRPQARRQRLVFSAVLGTALIIIACPAVIVQVFMPEHADWVWSDFLATWAEQTGVLWIVAAALFLSILGKPLLWRYSIWKGFRENQNQYRDLQVTFTDKGLDYTWPNAALHNEWSFYDGVIETSGFFLLIYGNLYIAVPRRALAERDVQPLAEMLRRHVPKYVKRD